MAAPDPALYETVEIDGAIRYRCRICDEIVADFQHHHLADDIDGDGHPDDEVSVLRSAHLRGELEDRQVSAPPS